jgi:hypothetical protein
MTDPEPLRSPEGWDRDAWIARYAFAVPTEEALRTVADASPGGVVEVGAGTGWWAHLLAERGVDVVAFDADPPPSPTSKWFAGSAPWHPVGRADESVVADHPGRTLLLVWPTRNEDWGGDAVARFAAAGGERLAYAGEAVGGRTGDDRLHALLGDLDRCWRCAYGVEDALCVCGVRPLWRRTATVELPHWDGYGDDLHLYERDRDAAPLGPAPPGRRGGRWGRRSGRV